jgi:hypothetical protein
MMKWRYADGARSTRKPAFQQLLDKGGTWTVVADEFLTQAADFW